MEQVARVVHWHHEPGTFRPLAREVEGEVQLVVCDGIGTPVGAVGQKGEVAWRGLRSVWGERGSQVRRHDEDGVPIGFPGQYFDEESGLFYNRFRYYEPELGAYVGPDPIGLAGGQQPWSYVDNTQMWIDPLGLAGCPIRVRHYTRTNSMKKIKSDMKIVSGDKGSVFTVNARKKLGSPSDAESRLGIKDGKGNAYIEFDASHGEFAIVENKYTGATEYVFSGDVDLAARNPAFKINR